MRKLFSLLVGALFCTSTMFASDVTDQLTIGLIGVSGTTYTDFSGKTATSDAVYAGQCAGGENYIQLRSKNSNSGIITTTSGGKVAKIIVKWNDSTIDDRYLDIYGKNEAYAAATDLYSDATAGTKLGSIKRSETSFVVEGDYQYLGLRSRSGAIYCDTIAITWSVEDANAGLADGDYYIQNVQSGLFLAGSNNWGTRASVVKEGDFFNVSLSEGGYVLSNKDLTSANKTLGYNLYTDTDVAANGNVWTIEGNNGVYTIYGQGKRDGAANAFGAFIAQATEAGTASGFVVGGVSAASTDAAKWKFLTREEAIAQLEGATKDAPKNASFLIANANFCRSHGGWTLAEGCTNSNLAGGPTDNSCAESYHSPFNLSQEITGLINGTYMVTAQGFYRQDGSDNEHLPVVFANEKERVLPLKTGTENNMDAAAASFHNGLYAIDPIYVAVTDGKLSLGVKNENASLWCIWDNIQLQFMGDANVNELELGLYIEEYNLAMAAAVAATEIVTGDALENLLTIIAAYTIDFNDTTKEALAEATAMLKAAVERAMKEYYESLKTDTTVGTDIINSAANSWVGQSGSYGTRAERYSTAMYTGNVMTQTIEGLVAGTKYEVSLEAAASYTSGRGFAGKTGLGYTALFANEGICDIEVIDRGAVSNFPTYKVVGTVGEDGKLTFGMKNVYEGGNWFVIAVTAIKVTDAAVSTSQIFADKAEFEAYKVAQIAAASNLLFEGDSEACVQLIENTQALIAALDYDATKTLAENKAVVDSLVADLVDALLDARRLVLTLALEEGNIVVNASNDTYTWYGTPVDKNLYISYTQMMGLTPEQVLISFIDMLELTEDDFYVGSKTFAIDEMVGLNDFMELETLAPGSYVFVAAPVVTDDDPEAWYPYMTTGETVTLDFTVSSGVDPVELTVEANNTEIVVTTGKEEDEWFGFAMLKEDVDEFVEMGYSLEFIFDSFANSAYMIESEDFYVGSKTFKIAEITNEEGEALEVGEYYFLAAGVFYSDAKDWAIVNGEVATATFTVSANAIENVAAEVNTNSIDLQGRKVAEKKAGQIYIVSGKKQLQK